MKALHVVENLDERYGGPAQTVPHLCNQLAALGVDVSLSSVNRYGVENNTIIRKFGLQWNNYCNTITDILRYSPDLKEGLIEQIQGNESLIHIHNQWNYPPYCAFKLSSDYGLPLICSIRGALYPWSLAQYKYQKKFFWHLFQKKLLENAACIHVTEPNELKAVRNMGIKAPVALIPNGIDVSEFEHLSSQEEARQMLGLPIERRYLLFLSRIHPKKGLDYLIRAFSQVSEMAENWDLIVAGPDEDSGHRRLVDDLVEKNGLQKRIHFLGLLGQKERLVAYAAADLFVLPSHTENFGVCVAEAMASKLPVITTQGTPWKEIVVEDCGWWIELSEKKLADSLKAAMCELSASDLGEMGSRGSRFVKQNYSWDLQANRMHEVYQWVLSDSEMPDWIDFC